MGCRRVAFAFAAFVAASGPAMAHHSFAMFDQGHEVDLDGVVQEFRYVAPHSFIILEVKQSDGGARKDLPLPDESCVMQLALLWSVDPTTLDEAHKEPAVGLLGTVPWARAEPVDEVERAGITAFRGGKSS